MKKMFLALAVLALAIVLLPMQEAKANYHRGDTCPKCGQNKISTFWGTTKLHNVWCSNCHWGQESNGDGTWTTLDSNREPHFGGTATCVKEAKCEGCNSTYGEIDPNNHTNLETFAAKEPTCTESGNNLYYYCKDCKKYLKADKKTETTVEKETIKAFHDWATTLTDGGDTHYYACSRCDAKKDEAAHSYGSWTKVDDETHEGTCVCGAKTTGEHVWNGSHWCGYPRKCSVCQEYYGETLGHEFWYEYKTEEQHKINCYHCDGLFGREDHSGGIATCTKKAVCEKCGEEYGDYAHDWGEWHVDPDDSTKHIRTCNNNCGASESHAISWGAWEKVDEENHKHTCQGGCGLSETVAHVWNGSHWCGYPRKCRDCGEFYGDVLDHEFWYEYKTEEQHKINCYHCDGLFGREDHSGGTATCTQKAVCEKCGHEYGALAEHTGGTATCTEKAKCEVCGQEYGEPLGHDLIHHDAQAPTCTAIGWDAYQTCSRCDYTTYAEKKALGHDLIDHAAQAPTCTAIGWDAYQTCSRCDYTTYTEKKALGHDLIDHAAQAPTCTAIGWDAYQTCSRCDYTTYAEKKALGHDLIDHAAQAPTCTAIGWDAYQTCSRCDYTTYVEKKALGHDLIDHPAQAPTCTAIGWDAYQTCSRCDYTTYTEKKALGHDLIEHEAQAPTCTAIGWDAYQTCSRCDYTTYAEKKALGHDLIDHAAQAPTCTAIGWDAYQTCSRCDYTTYTEKKALGHALIDHEAQTPTCTEIGWDAYQTCSRCNYTTYAEKPALGHSEVTGTAIAPTCTDNGLTEGMYCFRCGQVLIAQEDIPALGHDFAVTHRTITRVYFQCSRCRDSYWIDNAKSRNLLPGLVWNDRDENVEYTAGVAKANGIKVLTITPDAEAVEDSAWVSLRLKPGDVEQWKREGIGTVAFQCGEVRMEISLSALTLDWFDLNEPFDYYVFTLAPEEDGTLVTVEAEIGTEKVAADEYDGITLVMGDTILEIVQNGIY